MKERREIPPPRPDAPEGTPPGEELPDDSWDHAVLVEPGRRSVHLRPEQEAFDHFVAATGGKGHITRMQAVLEAYVEAKRKRAG